VDQSTEKKKNPRRAARDRGDLPGDVHHVKPM
jgi:hypothetical protein